MTARGRVVGLDPGERWVGVAVCDSERRLALPLGTIDRRAERDDGVSRIRELLGAEGVALLVVGVPLDGEGHEDEQAAAFRAYGEGIAAALGVAAVVQNERYSNPLQQAGPLAQAGKPPVRKSGRPTHAALAGRRRREHTIAAATILQLWLDRQSSDRPSAAGGAGADR